MGITLRRCGQWTCGTILGLVLGATACQSAKPPAPARTEAPIDYTQPLPPGQLALVKISPSEYPDFSKSLGTANIAELRESIQNSLAWFARPSSKGKYPYLDVDHARAVATLHAFTEIIDDGAFALAPGAFNARIADTFDVYQSIGAIGPDGSMTRKVLYTGYFTPTYDASLERSGEYQWPVYRRPADLVSDADNDASGQRLPGGVVGPYPTRQQIETGLLAGGELVWLKDRWSAYVITIQGSARLRLPDGKIMEVGYAGNNGRQYVSPGLKMVDDGVISRSELSFETMRRYFQAHPEAMDQYLWQNPRTVFFTQVHGGPYGALNVPVTRLASIATDKSVYPPGLIAFLSVPMSGVSSLLPGSGSMSEYNGFVLDQDRGGAIRSAGRCDIYMGIGETAEGAAGQQLNPGALYYFAVKGGR